MATKAELETQLKMANEANQLAFDILRGVMSALKENNFGTAQARCVNGVRKLDYCLDANEELLGEQP